MTPFCIKIINLASRMDRKAECLEELKKINQHDARDLFFEAKFMEVGEIGCALSHAMSLSEFLFYDERPFAIVLEDDFSILNERAFLQTIEKLMEHSFFWDVYLLGHNEALPIETTPLADTFRMINSLTTSGYLVGRRYVPKLIHSFFRSAELMKAYIGLPSPNRELARQFFCCDVMWKELQIENRFWGGIPSLIKQRRSYSDVAKKITDYGV